MSALTDFIAALTAADQALGAAVEHLQPDLDATNELADDLTALFTALSDLRQSAILLAFSRHELVPRIQLVTGDLLHQGDSR